MLSPDRVDELRPWLDDRLKSSYVDTERGVLVDYMVSLVRHADEDDGPSSFEDKLMTELADFLAEDTGPVVKDIILELKKRGWIHSAIHVTPGSSDEPSQYGAEPGPEEAEDAIKKDKIGSSPNTGIRGSPSRARSDRPTDDSSAWQDTSKTGSSTRHDKENFCRDFHLRGYCPRGAECRWSHAPRQPGPIYTSQENYQGAGGHQAPTLASRVGPRARSRSPTRRHDRKGDYNYRDRRSHNGPQEPHSQGDHQYKPASQVGRPESSGSGGLRIGQTFPAVPPFDEAGYQQRASIIPTNFTSEYNGYPADPYMSTHPPSAGFRQPFDRQRSNGHRSHDQPIQSEYQSSRTYTDHLPQSVLFDLSAHDPDATIVAEHLPNEALNEQTIRETFSKFGTVDYVQVDPVGKKSLIVFSDPAGAQASHQETAGFFNSRFVRLFYADGRDKPRANGHVRHPSRMRNPGRGGHSSTSFTAPPAHRGLYPQQHNPQQAASAAAATAVVEAKTKTALVEGLLGEQKRLMTSLSSVTSAEEKKATMSRLRDLAAQIPPATEAAKVANEVAQQARATMIALRSNPATPTPAVPGVGPPSTPSWRKPNLDEERQRLDAELDAMTAGREVG